MVVRVVCVVVVAAAVLVVGARSGLEKQLPILRRQPASEPAPAFMGALADEPICQARSSSNPGQSPKCRSNLPTRLSTRIPVESTRDKYANPVVLAHDRPDHCASAHGGFR